MLSVYVGYFLKANKNHEIGMVLDPIVQMSNVRITEVNSSQSTYRKPWLKLACDTGDSP